MGIGIGIGEQTLEAKRIDGAEQARNMLFGPFIDQRLRMKNDERDR